MTTIPANQLANVTPSVLAAGGTGLNVVGLLLTSNTRAPIGTVLSFTAGTAVTAYFGSGSTPDQFANGGVGKGGGYFAGFTGATKIPGQLFVAQYNPTAVAAYLRGSNVSALTIPQLQAINGSLNVTIDGYAHNAASVNLSGATSFSNAAATIQTAINGSLVSQASVTGSIAASTFSVTGSISGNVMYVTAVSSGSIVNGAAVTGTGVSANTVITGQISGTAGGIGVYAVNNSQVVASTTLSGTYGTLTVTATSSGTLAVGQTITGGTTSAGTIITQLGTGTGGNGTYFVNLTQTVASASLTGNPTAALVTFDSVSGAFIITSGITGTPSTAAFATGTIATALGLSSAAGGILSQGAAPATPAAFMTALLTTQANWVTFALDFDVDGGAGGGSVQKQAFAAWKNGASVLNTKAFICWDGDTATNPTTTVPATSSLGQILAGNGDSGTCVIWDPGNASNLAAFVMGTAAAIDFTKTKGRITFAFRGQAGLVANVTDPTTAGNLAGNPQVANSRGNGYNFYGAYANATQSFIEFQRGFVTGPFLWLDSYINQIWLNNLFQTDLLILQQAALSIPYSNDGNTLVEGALADGINQGLNFGAFGPDPLSASQIIQVNTQAGKSIANSIATQGYYVQILLAAPATRAQRTSPPMTFWYLDQGAVQSFNLGSVQLQ